MNQRHTPVPNARNCITTPARRHESLIIPDDVWVDRAWRTLGAGDTIRRAWRGGHRRGQRRVLLTRAAITLVALAANTSFGGLPVLMGLLSGGGPAALPARLAGSPLWHRPRPRPGHPPSAADAAAGADCISPRVRGTLAALSEPGSVRTMCSLAAGSSALKAARPMRDPAISQIFGAAITAARQPGQRPDAGPCVLCIYCQADRFVYWPAVRRLPSANCPRCQRREAAGGHVALPEGRPTRTRPTAHCLPEPAARAADSGRWADRAVRRDRVLHRRRPSADPVWAGAGPASAGCRPRWRCSPGACTPPQSPPDLPHPQPVSRGQGSPPAGTRGTASDRPRKLLPRRGPASPSPASLSGGIPPRSFWASYWFSGPDIRRLP